LIALLKQEAMKCIIGILIAVFISVGSQHETSAMPKTDWVGKYMTEDGTTLNVKAQTPSEITFEIVGKKTGDCQESFRGKAMLTTATNATYADKDNILVITLLKRTDGKIEVTETGFEHSPDCLPFSGIFKPTY
jgi:hypothetical protein